MIAVGSDTIRQIGLNHHHDYTLYFFRSAKGFPFPFYLSHIFKACFYFA